MVAARTMGRDDSASPVLPCPEPMSPEVVWLSGLALGLLGGVPIGIIVDRLLLSVRFLQRTEHDRDA